MIRTNYDVRNGGYLRAALIISLIIIWAVLIISLLRRPSTLLSSYSAMGRYSIYMLGFSLGVLMINQYRFLSFPVLFVVLVWFFHFGLFVTYYFDATDLITFDYLKEYYTVSECQNGYLICSVFFFFLTVGLLTKNTNDWIAPKENKIVVKKSFLDICLAAFLICLLPYYFYIFRNIASGSYDSFSLPNYMGYINYLLYATSIVLFYSQVQKGKKINCLLIACAFFPSVLTGARAEVMCLYLVFVLLFFRDMRIKFMSVFAFLFFSVVILYVVHVIGLYRSNIQTMITVMFDGEHFIEYLKKNPVLSMAGEFGSTVISVIGVERSFDISSFYYGKTYLAAFSTIIPRLNTVVPIEYLAFTLGIPRHLYHNLGGSLFGEAYVNFGWLGFVLIFGLGRIIRMIYNSEKRCYQNNETIYVYINIIYCFLFLVVRAYIKNIFFMGFWGGLGVYLYNKHLSANVKPFKYFIKNNSSNNGRSKYIK